jgi:hypothetical protein
VGPWFANLGGEFEDAADGEVDFHSARG